MSLMLSSLELSILIIPGKSFFLVMQRKPQFIANAELRRKLVMDTYKYAKVEKGS